MRHTIEAKFFVAKKAADTVDMVSFCLIGRGNDAVNTMTVNRFRKEHAGLWREVADDHAAWSRPASEAPAKALPAAVEEPKAPNKRARKAEKVA